MAGNGGNRFLAPALLLVATGLGGCPLAEKGKCVSLEESREYFGGQSVQMEVVSGSELEFLRHAYKDIYGEPLREADAALTVDRNPARQHRGMIHLVLFKGDCAAGEGAIPKEIYRYMRRGHPT